MSKKAVWYKITTEKSILVEIESEAQAEIIAKLNQDTERNAKVRKRDSIRTTSLEYLCEDLGMDFADDSLPVCDIIIQDEERRTRRKKLEHVMSKLTSAQYRAVKAARLIDQGIGKNDTNVLERAVKPEPRDKKLFKPNDGKIRKRGTGCIYRINENLWEGSFFPRHANGKRIKHNVYANTREECETLLAEMIVRIKEEIAAEKEALHEQSM